MPIVVTVPSAQQFTGSSITLQQVVNSARAYAELTPVLGASGWQQEPALTIANDVMQRFLSEPLNWKFNRAAVQPFQTIALQQDYVTGITNMGWLEQGWRIDINNTSNPKPVFSMETVRDLAMTSTQASPFNISWIPNQLAIMGTWQANTAYPTGLGVAYTPVSPIQQFIDTNGNILYVTTPGVSGSTAPAADPGSAPGNTVTDNTVTWSVADPNGIAIRLAPIPPFSGLVWQINPIYQMRPPIFTSLQQTISPIPDHYAFMFRQGFMASCYEHANSKEYAGSYAKWEESLILAKRAADRERDDSMLYPSTSIMGSPSYQPLPIGPAFPFDWYAY